jgi:RNA polymerase sigma-70 factor (ECF subfamily)
MNLTKVIEGCIKNNRKSQKEFYVEYSPRLMAISLRMSPDDDTAKDLLQESFLKIFKNLSTLDNHEPAVVYTWCKRLVSNTIIDYIRKNRHIYVIDTFEQTLEDSDIGSEDGIEYGYLDSKNISPTQLMKAIQTLSPQYKLVFNLYVMEGYTHQEIGDTLNISVGTSKSNLYKARMNMRKELELCQ